MNEISDSQKLKWLTTSAPRRGRLMINTGTFEDRRQVPGYTVTPIRRQIPQPSVGELDKLSPELLHMLFSHLTCDDLEALHSCSTGCRQAVLDFPWYQNLLRHAPTILAILKQTQLAGSFTIRQIYEAFKSTLCTNCGQFGGYIFLPSFARCCITCAEIELKFAPITRQGAKFQFGIKEEKIFDSLPQFKNLKGNYSTSDGDFKYYDRRSYLYSREMVEKFRDPKREQRHQQAVIRGSFKTKWRYMALTPFPCFIPGSTSVERGVYCIGCQTRAREHGPCEGSNATANATARYKPTFDCITDGANISCQKIRSPWQCPLIAARDRRHDSRHVLSHLEGCESAQAFLEVRWILSQDKIHEVDFMKYSVHPYLREVVDNLLTWHALIV